MSRIGAVFQGRKGAVLSISLIVWALALFDLTLLPRTATRYLGTLPPKRLTDATVAEGSVLMTSVSSVTPANLWILSRRDTDIRVIGVAVPPMHSRRGAWTRTLTADIRTNVRVSEGRPIDVEDWLGRGSVLFVVSSPRRSTSLRLLSLQNGRTLLDSRVPLPPQKSDRREFFVARWSGRVPDLFAIDRDANRRKRSRSHPWTIRVYSGESGFKELAFETSIRKRLSKQLSLGDFWLDIGTRRNPKPSLVLMTKGRTGTEQTEIHVLSGHSGFRRFTLQAGTELPDQIGLSRRFIFQSERRGGSAFMVRIRDGRLSLVPVPLP